MRERFEDTKWVIRSRKSKSRQHKAKRKRSKRKTIVDIILQIKLNIEQYEPN